MTIFETHAHFDDERFDEDRASLLESMPKRGISPIINVGATLDGAKKSLELAKEYPFVYAAIGVHPSDIETLKAPDAKDGDPEGDAYEYGLSWIRANMDDSRVVAIGEIGLDYYWEKDEEVRKRQRELFAGQLSIAREAKLPVIIHSRDACEDTLSIIKEAVSQGNIGVMHCFSYSPEIAIEYVKMGFYIGVGGVCTFKNAKKLCETVRRIPMSSILLETDCPYMAPSPFRGQRNDSSYLPYIARQVARLRDVTEEYIIEETAKNAKRLFERAA